MQLISFTLTAKHMNKSKECVLSGNTSLGPDSSSLALTIQSHMLAYNEMGFNLHIWTHAILNPHHINSTHCRDLGPALSLPYASSWRKVTSRSVSSLRGNQMFTLKSRVLNSVANHTPVEIEYILMWGGTWDHVTILLGVNTHLSSFPWPHVLHVLCLQGELFLQR